MTQALTDVNTKFVETPGVTKIIRKAVCYLNAGLPVHFSGPPGAGKTTLAIVTANQLGRPVILMHGDDEYSSSDLVGGNFGLRRKKVIDNYIHSVWKGEEAVDSVWFDGRLTKACRIGATLIYDEFTRSRPETNNVLLSVLEEKMLDLSGFHKGEQLLKVNPHFSVIFTSNPEEYAGVHKLQDALRDRMVNIDLSHYDRDTEIAITRAKSGLAGDDVERIVNLVRDLRNLNNVHFAPSIRASIMIAKICRQCKAVASSQDPFFREICRDVLMTESSHGYSMDEKSKIRKSIDDLITLVC